MPQNRYTFIRLDESGDAAIVRRGSGKYLDLFQEFLCAVKLSTPDEVSFDEQACRSAMRTAFYAAYNPGYAGGEHTEHNLREMTKALKALGKPVPTIHDFSTLG